MVPRWHTTRAPIRCSGGEVLGAGFWFLMLIAVPINAEAILTRMRVLRPHPYPHPWACPCPCTCEIPTPPISTTTLSASRVARTTYDVVGTRTLAKGLRPTNSPACGQRQDAHSERSWLLT